LLKCKLENAWQSRSFSAKDLGIIVDLRPNISQKFHALTKNDKHFTGTREKTELAKE